ncbi:MAG: ankyrin repeat domain-containing protein [Gammaproteobacteria bacterium]|nr:ankyrin repeat domain-containing protein [Gammaproteobacteria bacterium]
MRRFVPLVVVLAGCGGGESTPAGPENQAVCPPGWNTGTFFRTATSAHIAACMEAGESVRARDPEGNTPLHLAGGFSDDPAVIQALISAGASAGATNDLGYTVLCFAVAENENTPVIQALLDGGSQTSDLCRAPGDVNGIYPGVSPLHVAARFNPNPDVAEVLIRAGADVNAEGGIGGTSTPLFFAACCNDNPAMVEFLLRSGAELRWAAQPASRNENPDILRILIAAGAELSGALHRAVFNRTTEVTEILIAAGADLNERHGLDGMTALHSAARAGMANLAALEALLRAGADPNVLDDNGMTALDWAESSGQTQIAALLREHGGRNG